MPFRRTFNRLLHLLLLLLFAIVSHGCGRVNYSFTGAAIDFSQYKTISIATFYNNAGTGPANLAQTFTESMRDYFQSNTPLKLVSSNGHLHIEGSIVGYEVAPVAPTGDLGTQVQSSLNRLTIRVQVKYVDTKDESRSFEQPFSAYEDFPQNRTLSQVERDLIPVISERVVFDVFNRSVANW